MKYTAIWREVKKNMKAEVTVSMDNAATVKQGVIRTKTVENMGRRLAGQIPYSRLKVSEEVISKERRLVKITFELMYEWQIKPVE